MVFDAHGNIVRSPSFHTIEILIALLAMILDHRLLEPGKIEPESRTSFLCQRKLSEVH